MSSVLAFAAHGMYPVPSHYINLPAEPTTGVVIACKLNAPGSWHDSRVAKQLYENLHTRTPKGYYLVTDTAFPKGTDEVAGRIKSPMKSGARLPSDLNAQKAALAFDWQLLSFRQTAEWGM